MENNEVMTNEPNIEELEKMIQNYMQGAYAYMEWLVNNGYVHGTFEELKPTLDKFAVDMFGDYVTINIGAEE